MRSAVLVSCLVVWLHVVYGRLLLVVELGNVHLGLMFLRLGVGFIYDGSCFWLVGTWRLFSLVEI